MHPSIILFAVIGGVALIVFIGIYNGLVGRKNRVSFAFASIDAQLKKRFDLIPNLVATCEKYMGYEESVLQKLTNARAKAAGGNLGDAELSQLDGQVTGTLRNLFAVAENYPQLRASDSFLHLHGSLNEVEEQLAASRRAYNAAVTDYNNGCETFPSSIIAGLMGYRVKAWFEIPQAEREPVQVWR